MLSKCSFVLILTIFDSPTRKSLSLRDLHGNNFQSAFQSSMELVELAFPSCSRHEINSSLSSTNLAALSASATRIIYFDEMRRLMHVIKDTSSINKTVAHIPLCSPSARLQRKLICCSTHTHFSWCQKQQNTLEFYFRTYTRSVAFKS